MSDPHIFRVVFLLRVQRVRVHGTTGIIDVMGVSDEVERTGGNEMDMGCAG